MKLVFGLLLVLAGFLCLNYTKASGAEHHVEWATEHGLPAPNNTIFLSGAGALALGGIVIGRAASGKKKA
jgi:hypothetical protein